MYWYRCLSANMSLETNTGGGRSPVNQADDSAILKGGLLANRAGTAE